MEEQQKSTLEEFLWEGQFSEEQYDILIRCAEAGSMKEWILYRKRHRKEPILLEGALFKDCDLSKADLKNANLKQADFSRSVLTKTQLMHTKLNGARFDGATLEHTDFLAADLTSCRFTSVKGEEVSYRFCDLSNADFHEAELPKSNFDRASLKKVFFHGANLSHCHFDHTQLNGTKITESILDSARFNAAIVDGETLLWDCHFDFETDFTGVGLTNARIEPQLLSRFETNVRRIWWKNHLQKREQRAEKLLKQRSITSFLQGLWEKIVITLTQLFWWTTDFGSSTARLMKSLFLTSLFFALLYTFIPNITSENFFAMPLPIRFIRALYFSVVTTTTVGFGDIAANKTSLLSHIILILHLLTGYTLLGALIVRLGILFQSLPEAKLPEKEEDHE